MCVLLWWVFICVYENGSSHLQSSDAGRSKGPHLEAYPWTETYQVEKPIWKSNIKLCIIKVLL